MPPFPNASFPPRVARPTLALQAALSRASTEGVAHGHHDFVDRDLVIVIDVTGLALLAEASQGHVHQLEDFIHRHRAVAVATAGTHRLRRHARGGRRSRTGTRRRACRTRGRDTRARSPCRGWT